MIATAVEAVKTLRQNPALLAFIRDAHAHCKIIGFTRGATALFDAIGIEQDTGVINIDTADGAMAYIDRAKQGRLWSRKKAGAS